MIEEQQMSFQTVVLIAVMNCVSEQFLHSNVLLLIKLQILEKSR